MQSAGVTLVKGDLAGIARARRLSRLVMRNIRQNLFQVDNVSAVFLFCDDLRREENGKLTAVGLYGADLIVESQESPSLRIAGLMRVIGPSDVDIAYIHSVVYLDDEVIHELHVSPERMEAHKLKHKEDIAELESLESNFENIEDAVLVQGPLVFGLSLTKAIALLRVTVDIGRGSIRAGSMPIKRIGGQNWFLQSQVSGPF